MNREDEIIKAATRFQKDTPSTDYDLMVGFNAGVNWADEHPIEREDMVAYFHDRCENIKEAVIEQSKDWIHDYVVEHIPEMLGCANLLKGMEEDYLNFMKDNT